MAEEYFNIPFYKRLTSEDGWNREDRAGTYFHVARAFFRMNTRQLPGPANIGQKIDVLGHIKGIETGKIKTVEIEKEVFQQVNTIKQSIIDSQCLLKVFDELTLKFGNGKIFKVGGKVGAEASSRMRSSFSESLNITNSSRKKEVVKYEFKEILPADFTDTVCAVEVYQRCAADLYLIQVDFLNVKYERKMFGLRKKIHKYPFPDSPNSNHPNVIKIGIPVATLEYWQLLPQSSLWIKDSNYKPEVLDEGVEGDRRIILDIQN